MWLERVLGALVLLAALACSHAAEPTPEPASPPEFRFLPEKQLGSTMWKLAEGVSQLDRLLRDADPRDPRLQVQVVRVLGEMEQASRSLKGDWPGHPRLGRGAKAFQEEVAAAREAAAENPPSYFLAGSVSGACLNCH